MDTFYNKTPLSPFAQVRTLIEHNRFQLCVTVLIVLNAALLGLETSPMVMEVAGDTIRVLDQLILTLFTLEIVTRILVYKTAFWKDPWSLFDFTVVSIALIPYSGPFAVLRALRVLRVLRLLTIVPSMRRVISALLGAIPGLLSIGFVLLIIYYVFAVIATNLFGNQHPEWFGSLGASLYTLFQIMTLESWSMGIARPVMESFPYAWTFFIPFILVATFTMLNLFIAIIVNAMQSYTETEHKETINVVQQVGAHIESDLSAELMQLRMEIKELKNLIQHQSM